VVNEELVKFWSYPPTDPDPGIFVGFFEIGNFSTIWFIGDSVSADKEVPVIFWR